MSDTATVPREWAAHPDTPGLPPDLTARSGCGCVESLVAQCEWADRFGWGFHCTRRAGHTGRHAAGGGRYILAVWS